MFCMKCGAQLDEGAKFCPKCGTPVQQLGGNTPNGISIPEHPITPQSPPLQMSGFPGSGSESDTAAEEKKQGRTLIILLIILALVLLAGLGGGAYYFMGSYQSGRDFSGSGGEEDDREYIGRGDDREDEAEDETAAEEEKEIIPIEERQPINLNIRQVDNSNFPEITFYASIVDENNNVVEGLDASDFKIQEIGEGGQVMDVTINEVYKVLNEDTISVNLVLDASGSMDEWNKMDQAKNAAKALVNKMRLDQGDQVEVISFDDYVYLNQDFTRQESLLTEAIDNIQTGNMTALYDALYAGLYQTYYESGAKCVIGFTDGLENASSYTFDDVVTMSQNTSIPVFIIGIGEEYDADALRSLAAQCSGEYYSANVTGLEDILTDIYLTIYEEQQEYYVFKYTASDTEHQNQFRDIVLETSETTEFYGTYTKEYIPQSDISGAFAAAYMDMDYMLDFSSQREVTEADLSGLSLAQLRIARNEIFARHGRQFRDTALNQWFYSREWYLNLPEKYSPDDFDKISPSPLSKLEIQNVDFISSYEKDIMEHSDIYPNASDTLLSDYDLALSKAVLKNAMVQMRGYRNTDILRENMRLVQEVIDKEDIEY